jgi:hypothetical protein
MGAATSPALVSIIERYFHEMTSYGGEHHVALLAFDREWEIPVRVELRPEREPNCYELE